MSNQDTLSFFGENRSLFSDYYLRERLHKLPEWEQNISEPFNRALELYQQKKAVLPGMNEAQTENEFIQPMLQQVLGYAYDVQKAEKKQGRTNIPDYILFPDADALKKAQQKPDHDDSYYHDALALSDAKYWDRPLDSKGIAEKDLYTNANPSFQIVNYLTVTGLEWGILTNGSRWRLYSTKSRSRIDSYFEVDLKQILEEENKEQFRYFYHFFCRQAFQKDPQTEQSFVERVFEGSIDYGTRLEKRLKDLIFDDVFLLMSRGFVEYRKEETDIEAETDESLKEIYQGTLRLLYRLLFLLHAESRSLLPLDNKGYLQYSLMELKKNIANRIDNDIPQVAQSFDVWNDLDSLFNIIDKGAPEINVPRYNGGLFRRDHPNNRFLSEHKISDKYLVPALELLTRETEPNEAGRKPFIDYKSLNVEQLGSIYEGLLEFHLRQSDENDNGQKELFLENDKGERKATGSYYTPHYIVEYIVEHTLGPVFDERKATFEDLMQEWEPKYEQFKALDEKVRQGDQSERTHNKRKKLDVEVRTLGKRATETLLNLKICDPAMGSGHFLKEATDKLAEMIITLLADYPENPVTNLLENVRSQILESLAEQDISIDAEEHLKDTNLIKRMVMKRSIYGVDLNPMAVELAKLSLWLDSFTVGAPLSFLDHHLKVGNSLIGTTVKDVKRTLELDDDRQIEAFGGPFTGMLTATELMRDVSLSTDATFTEIKESVQTFSEYEKSVKPYKRLLDLWISRHFENEKAIVLLRQYPGKIIKEVKGEESDLHENYVPVLEKAEAQANDRKFFHWELEFPEVFVNLKQSKWLEDPGFDVVVGNPPWAGVRGKHSSGIADDLSIKYLESVFPDNTYMPNAYEYFILVSLDIINKRGYNSFIVPDRFGYNSSLEYLRKKILDDYNLEELIYKLPFPGIIADTMIYIVTNKSNGSTPIEVSEFRYPTLEINPDFYRQVGDHAFVFFQNEKVLSTVEKIDKQTKIHLGDILESTSGFGGKSALITDQKKSDNQRAVLKGEDIDRYLLRSNHYFDFKDENITGRTRDEKKLSRKPKVLLRKTGNPLYAALEEEGVYPEQSLYFLYGFTDKISAEYITALLNSKLFQFYYSVKLVTNRDSTPQLKNTHLDKFPVVSLDNLSINKIKADLNKIVDNQGFTQFLELSSFKKLNELITYLVRNMIGFKERKESLLNALDPFKFLNKGVAFNTFSDVFANAIKYGEQFTDGVDIGTVHHDIEGLQLRPQDNHWMLSARLKHRDPETGWSDWEKEDGNIVRSTHDIYRFELSDEQARYWQQSFEVLDDFENSDNFPGGKTRSTFEKLMKSKVPVYDKSANIEPLIELREELSQVEKKIEKTDWLIDRVVYRLYGLGEQEIAIVEESV